MSWRMASVTMSERHNLPGQVIDHRPPVLAKGSAIGAPHLQYRIVSSIPEMDRASGNDRPVPETSAGLLALPLDLSLTSAFTQKVAQAVHGRMLGRCLLFLAGRAHGYSVGC